MTPTRTMAPAIQIGLRDAEGAAVAPLDAGGAATAGSGLFLVVTAARESERARYERHAQPPELHYPNPP